MQYPSYWKITMVATFGEQRTFESMMKQEVIYHFKTVI